MGTRSASPACLVAIVLGLIAVSPAEVSAKGPIHPGSYSFAQVSTTNPAGEGLTYATIQSGDSTVLLGIESGTGTIETMRLIQGRLSLPVTGFSQTGGGVSANGETIALIGSVWRGHPATRIVVLSTAEENLQTVADTTFRGEYGIEGLSPDGVTLFVAKHGPGAHTEVSRIELTELGTESVAPDVPLHPLVEYEADFGFPLTQHTDGRWTYTLYPGDPGLRPRWREPRIVALDSLTGSWHQIQLRELRGAVWPSPSGLPMLAATGVDPNLLAVLNPRGQVVASYDPATRATYYPLPEYLLTGS